MPPDHNLDDYVDPYTPGHRHGGPLRVGLGGPVGSGKTALAAALCRTLGSEFDLAVVTNDIYTTEDADFLRRNDAYTFFSHLGDLVVTGPTRTNVMDLYLVLTGR